MKGRTKFLILLLLVLESCQMTVEIPIPESPVLPVVNSLFTTDDTWYVYVSLSKSLLDGTPIEWVSNASINIQQEDGSALNVTYAGYDGAYLVSDTALAGLPYHLSVSVPGYQTITSDVTTPLPIALTNVVIDSSEHSPDIGFTTGTIPFTLSFHDPSGIHNYYDVEVAFEYIWTYQMGSNPPVTETVIRSYPIQHMEPALKSVDPTHSEFSDEFFDGHDFDLSVRARIPPRYDKILSIRVTLKSLSESFYLYQTTTVAQEIASENPLIPPVVIFNNIENGIGIFAGQSSSTKLIEVP
jgi:hypothetical protein